MYYYILRLYGHLINGQKALVTLNDIQVFFDIHIPDGETPDECEEEKDDPKPLKQLCLVNVEIESDPHWTTIIYRNQGLSSQYTQMDVEANDRKVRNKRRNPKGSGEKIEEKKDYMEAIKIKITAEEDFFSSFLKLL
ncbi:6379_t:CDS:2, partial [Funneliformis geosporum]